MIIIVTTIACFTCGVIGYFVGWITTADRLDRREEAAVTVERPSVFPAQEAEEFWANVKWDGAHARSSPRVTAGGGFPALPAVPRAMRVGVAGGLALSAAPGQQVSPSPRPGVVQAPLGELVQPGRTTDFIAKQRADTDRWLADRGLLEVTGAPE